MVDEESEKAQNLHVLGESYFLINLLWDSLFIVLLNFMIERWNQGKENLDTLIEMFVISLLILWSTIEKILKYLLLGASKHLSFKSSHLSCFLGLFKTLTSF